MVSIIFFSLRFASIWCLLTKIKLRLCVCFISFQFILLVFFSSFPFSVSLWRSRRTRTYKGWPRLIPIFIVCDDDDDDSICMIWVEFIAYNIIIIHYRYLLSTWVRRKATDPFVVFFFLLPPVSSHRHANDGSYQFSKHFNPLRPQWKKWIHFTRNDQ